MVGLRDVCSDVVKNRGYRVLTPAYPGFEVEVEALNADPTPIEELTVPAVVEHLESVVSELDPAPDPDGPFGGWRLHPSADGSRLRRCGRHDQFGADEGVKRLPLSQIRSSFPILKNPANRRKAVGFTFEQWRYVFTNTFSEQESRRLYERYHIPASGRVFWGSALANIHRGRDDTYVNYENANRAPLLFISGGKDHLMPPSIQRSDAKHYKAEGTITEVKEYEGRSHLMPSQQGCEEVADYALTWATEHALAWATRRSVPSTA
jgi:pimeloyl-ACP methyl ester carboxylesterase